jgi:hypothetical protein
MKHILSFLLFLGLFTEGVFGQKFSQMQTARPRNNTPFLGGENDNGRKFTFGEMKDSTRSFVRDTSTIPSTGNSWMNGHFYRLTGTPYTYYFPVNGTRLDFVGASIAANTVDTVYDYAALRAYTGVSTSVLVRKSGVSGIFQRTPSVTSDNGGTQIFGNGVGWSRMDDGDVNIEWFGASTAASNNFVAIQAAINTGKAIRLPNGEYSYNGVLKLHSYHQSIYGSGANSHLRYVGNDTAITSNGKQFVSFRDFRLTAQTAKKGLHIGLISHNFFISNVQILGNIGSPTANSEGLSVEQSFYGTIIMVTTKGFGIGRRYYYEANGNTDFYPDSKGNNVNVQVDDVGESTNGVQFFGGNLESSGLAGVIAVNILGCQGIVFSGTRMEIDGGGTHVRVKNTGNHNSEFNTFTDIIMQGPGIAYDIGDAIGSGQVAYTRISGGRSAGAISIGADCSYTTIESGSSTHTGILTDNGIASSVHIDPMNGKHYDKHWSSATEKKLDYAYGGAVTRNGFGSNRYQMSFTNNFFAHQFYELNLGGIWTPIFQIGTRRVWAYNGLLYGKDGSDPTALTDGFFAPNVLEKRNNWTVAVPTIAANATGTTTVTVANMTADDMVLLNCKTELAGTESYKITPQSGQFTITWKATSAGITGANVLINYSVMR